MISLTLSRVRGTFLGTLGRNFEISANRKDKVGKQKLVTGALIYQTLVCEFFPLINKLISELLADLIGRSQFENFRKERKSQFFLLKNGSRLCLGIFDLGEIIFRHWSTQF